jgi:hypothetical protein
MRVSFGSDLSRGVPSSCGRGAFAFSGGRQAPLPQQSTGNRRIHIQVRRRQPTLRTSLWFKVLYNFSTGRRRGGKGRAGVR